MVSLSNHAEVAESVDASVSKTDEVTLVPVRSRPSVRKKSSSEELLFLLLFHRHRLGEIAWLVNIAASHHSNVVSQNLQRHCRQ